MASNFITAKLGGPERLVPVHIQLRAPAANNSVGTIADRASLLLRTCSKAWRTCSVHDETHGFYCRYAVLLMLSG
jgi:hypothetical protein